jgi:GAF domain-containing protein
MKNGEVVMVLDVDSDRLNDFDSTDEEALGAIVRVIEGTLQD